MATIVNDIASKNRVDIVTKRGDTFTFDENYVSIWVDDCSTVPLDLTGYTGGMQVRCQQNEDEVNLELTTGNSGLVFGGANNNEISFFLLSVDIKPFNYVYDLRIIETATGKSVHIMEGYFKVTSNVTRD